MFDNAGQDPIEATIQAAIKGGDWEEHKTVEYTSSLSDRPTVGFAALRRINDEVPKSLYEKIKYYMGDNRIPL